MDNLYDLLGWHVSRKDRMFSGYGINNYNYEGQAWTTVALSADIKADESTVLQMLRRLESDINQLLSQDQQPRRLLFYVENDSNITYWAKSRIVRGTLSARDAAKQMSAVSSSLSEDGEETRPNTPQPEVEETMRKKVVEIEL